MRVEHAGTVIYLGDALTPIDCGSDALAMHIFSAVYSQERLIAEVGKLANLVATHCPDGPNRCQESLHVVKGILANNRMIEQVYGPI